MNDDSLSLRVLHGADILPHLDELARLRIAVFRAWPYLYEGTWDNERDYLESFSRSPSSAMVLASEHGLQGSRVVGVATAMALADESEPIVAPFRAAGHDVSHWFYLAESVLLEEYRGRGVGHAFFDEREAAGKRAGFRRFTFCSVERRDDDPRKPPGARSLEPFWRGRGYAPLGLSCTLEWRETGSLLRTTQTLHFWAKEDCASPG